MEVGDFRILERIWGLEELNELLREFRSFKEDEDTIVWLSEPIERYIMNSGHILISKESDSEEQEEGKSKVFEKIWKVQVLFRIRVFGWRVFLNMIVCKDQLFRRRILSSNIDMSLCVVLRDSKKYGAHIFRFLGGKKGFLHSSIKLRKKNLKGKGRIGWR